MMLKWVDLTTITGESLMTSMWLHAVTWAPHVPSSEQLPEHTTHLPVSTPSPGLQIFNSCLELMNLHVTHLSDKSLTQALNSWTHIEVTCKTPIRQGSYSHFYLWISYLLTSYLSTSYLWILYLQTSYLQTLYLHVTQVF